MIDLRHVTTRSAAIADAEAIRTIYNAAVVDTTFTFDLVPRTIEEQIAWQEARSGAHTVLVAESAPNHIVGFASLSPYRARPAYATTVEDSIYLEEAARGHGLGRVLLTELVDTARHHGFHAMMARIVDGHDASIRLHRSLDFELVGVEREVGRKFGRWLDVAIMQLLL